VSTTNKPESKYFKIGIPQDLEKLNEDILFEIKISNNVENR